MNRSPIIFRLSPVAMCFTTLAMVLCLGFSDSVRAGEKTSSRRQNVKLADIAYKPNEVLVLMSADTGKKGALQAAETLKSVEKLSAGKVRKQIRLSKSKQIVSLTLPADKSVKQALAENWSKKDPRILLVEPNWRVRKMTTPDDTLYPNMWGLDNAGQSGGTVDADIDAPEAWNITTGDPNVIVAVIDSGVDYLHPDLAANIWTNAIEAAGVPGVDDDGNGYIDDIHGYDFAMNDGDPMDTNGHGTHVSGTIAAVGNNNLGVVGVNWQCKIMACRFLDASGGGWTDDAIEAINYAVANGAKILSNSWGGGGYSSLLGDAIANARDNGVLFVAAAGNSASDNDAYPSYPAGYNVSNVISVASTDRNDNLSSFSSFGHNSVHLGAPGSSILSSVPPYRMLFWEDFQNTVAGGFDGTQITASGSWITLPCSFNTSSIVARTDSVSYPYSSNNDSYIMTPPLDTRDLRGLSLQFLFRGEVGADDVLRAEVWDGSAWQTFFNLSNISAMNDWYYIVIMDIPDAWRNDQMQIRFRWITNDVDNNYYGIALLSNCLTFKKL
jgi:hypothetical protein